MGQPILISTVIRLSDASYRAVKKLIGLPGYFRLKIIIKKKIIIIIINIIKMSECMII